LPNENYPGLAMSRAFGDFILKDHGVIATPDIWYHRLTSSDQFIVLASDGVRVLIIITTCIQQFQWLYHYL